MSNELEEINEQISIDKVNGKTTIVFRKAQLKGRVSSSEVMNTILIAARMQSEMYIKKLSRGSPLDPAEVKCLKDLAEIAKIQIEVPEVTKVEDSTQIENIKSALYLALTDKLTK